MHDDELLEFASRLEASADIDAAQSQLEIDKPWVSITGNRVSLLCFAAAFLRAAAAPIPEDECRAEPETLGHFQINDAETDHILGSVQRIDAFPENPDVVANRKRSDWDKDRVGLIGCALVVCVFLSLLISGIAFWWQIFTGTPLP